MKKNTTAKSASRKSPISEAEFRKGIHEFAGKAHAAAASFYLKHHDNPTALAAFTSGLDGGKKPRRSRNVRIAEAIEALFIEHENDRLDEQTAERAQLMSDILYEIGNESGVSATHPQIVKGYVLAIWEALPNLQSTSDYDAVKSALDQVHELLTGCSQARFDQIDTIWNGDCEERMKARCEEAGENYEAFQARQAEQRAEAEIPESLELVTLRVKLTSLDRIPENEEIRFQLESEIYKLERKENDEWPDVIGGAQ